MGSHVALSQEVALALVSQKQGNGVRAPVQVPYLKWAAHKGNAVQEVCVSGAQSFLYTARGKKSSLQRAAETKCAPLELG